MPLKFTPKTEEEVKSAGMFDPGVYDFEIVKAEDQTSKAGNDMVKIVLKVFHQNGDFILMSDYLLTDESMAFKLRHCCAAIGILPKYESGELESGDFVTGTGQIKLKIDKGKPKKDEGGNLTGEMYPDRNGVVDYIPARSEEEKNTAAKNHGLDKTGGKKKNELNDAIPWD